MSDEESTTETEEGIWDHIVNFYNANFDLWFEKQAEDLLIDFDKVKLRIHHLLFPLINVGLISIIITIWGMTAKVYLYKQSTT